MADSPDSSPSPRIILVTGANGGLGQAIARHFLEKSDEDIVALGVNRNRDQAESLHRDFPDRTVITALDVTSQAHWSAAVDSLLRDFGRLDVLVNNAGYHRDHLLANMPAEDWSGVIQGNLDSVFLGCQAVVKTMMSQRFGRIINISSLSALLAPLGQTNYAAAKAGVIGLTQSLAKEVARAGITVNALCPGYVETEAVSGMSDEEKKALARQIPMRRFARPREIAAAVYFLACEDAGYITGSTLKIDGGIF